MTTFFIIFFFGLLAILARVFWRERKYLKKPTREVLRAEILDELKAEKAEFERESNAFKAALTEAQKKTTKRPLSKEF